MCIVRSNLDNLKKIQFDFLHPEEIAYFTTLKYEKRQLSYLLGRYAAKIAISRYLATEVLQDILIETGIFQQPLVITQCKPVQVTLSHSEEISIALAFSEAHPMGIDLECINLNQVTTIQSQMTEQEMKTARSIQMTSESSEIYTHYWTAKEALSKVLKTGLMIAMDILEISSIEPLDAETYLIEFKNFFQYSAISFKLDNFVVAIAHPKHTQLELNIKAIQQSFRRAPLLNYL